MVTPARHSAAVRDATGRWVAAMTANGVPRSLAVRRAAAAVGVTAGTIYRWQRSLVPQKRPREDVGATALALLTALVVLRKRLYKRRVDGASAASFSTSDVVGPTFRPTSKVDEGGVDGPAYPA